MPKINSKPVKLSKMTMYGKEYLVLEESIAVETVNVGTGYTCLSKPIVKRTIIDPEFWKEKLHYEEVA